MKKGKLNDKVLPLLAGTIFAVGTSLAQTSGEIDELFGISGYVVTDHVPGIGEVFNDLIALEDDKLLMVGFVNDANQDLLLARYNADGSLDATFGNNGKVTIDLTIGADEQATAATVLFDGKILVTGGMNNGGTIDAFILRLNEDGTLDNSFGTGGMGYTVLNAGANSLAFGADVEVDASNNIFVAATAANAMANYDMVVFKLSQGGGLDAGFGTAGAALIDNAGATDYAYNLALSQSGKIAIVGYTENGDTRGFVARLNSTGGMDLTFNATGGYVYDPSADSESIMDVCFDTGDKVIAVGMQGAGTNIDGVILRLGDDGVLDNTFGTSGAVISDIGSDNGVFLRRVEISEHGKIFAAGYVDGLTLRSPYVISLFDDGNADTDFAPGGDAIPEFTIAINGIIGTGMAIQSDGNVVLGGTITSQDFAGENMYMMRLYGIEAALELVEETTEGIVIYPNPVQDDFRIHATNEVEEVRLIDLNGHIVASWEGADYYKLRENVVGGSYFLHIATPSGNVVHKLVIVR